MTSARRDARRRDNAAKRRVYENSMGSAKNVISETVDVAESYNMMASFQRSNSHDKVRKIVAEEGRTARNLIAWSVPLESKEDDSKYLTSFPPTFPYSPTQKRSLFEVKMFIPKNCILNLITA
uniref:Uncharacterized protein n=1 Tax=Chrysemys picta bellii TaxID=8478 RepID=A0A8C3ICY3_CHRPI